jgi:protease II
MEAGLVRGDHLSVDCSFIQANASLLSRIPREQLTEAAQVKRYDAKIGKSTLLKREESPGYDPSQYVSERQWATAQDGVKVPLSIVYKKDTNAMVRSHSCRAPMALSTWAGN